MVAELGWLEQVDPREVWPHEARDFTPWLLANPDVLSEAIGVDLDLEAVEHRAGEFSLDLSAPTAPLAAGSSSRTSSSRVTTPTGVRDAPITSVGERSTMSAAGRPVA